MATTSIILGSSTLPLVYVETAIPEGAGKMTHEEGMLHYEAGHYELHGYPLRPATS
jgi:hypothetical protein